MCFVTMRMKVQYIPWYIKWMKPVVALQFDKWWYICMLLLLSLFGTWYIAGRGRGRDSFQSDTSNTPSAPPDPGPMAKADAAAEDEEPVYCQAVDFCVAPFLLGKVASRPGETPSRVRILKKFSIHYCPLNIMLWTTSHKCLGAR